MTRAGIPWGCGERAGGGGRAEERWVQVRNAEQCGAGLRVLVTDQRDLLSCTGV